MALKNLLDFSDFIAPDEALDLMSQGIRKAFDYDSYAGKNEFVAVVLSNPIPFDTDDMKVFTSTDVNKSFDPVYDFLGISKAPRRISKFSFRARILGENSPHEFLPDPCDPAYAADNAKILKIIAMHTLFMSTEDYQLQAGKTLPTRGDLVKVNLNHNVFGYDLQKGSFIDVMHKSDMFDNIGSYSSGQNCVTSIAATFGAGGGLPGVVGTNIAATPHPAGAPQISGSVVSPLPDGTYSESSRFGIWRCKNGSRCPTAPSSGAGPCPIGLRHTGTIRCKSHGGADLAAARGTPIFAVAAGKVVTARDAGSAGNMVTIEHTEPDKDGRTIRTLYMHMNTINVKKDAIVAAGDQIGTVGSTGRSTGPHLHIELWIKNNTPAGQSPHAVKGARGPWDRVDPISFIEFNTPSTP